MRLCTEEGCERKHSAKGYCGYHYSLNRVQSMTEEVAARQQRIYELKYRHNLTFSDAQVIWDNQSRECACCHKTGPPLFDYCRDWPFDHDPKCCPRNKSCAECRRGIVCRSCNVYALNSHMTLEVWKSVGEYLKYKEEDNASTSGSIHRSVGRQDSSSHKHIPRAVSPTRQTGGTMPIWRVELTGEWLVEDVEAEDEYEAEQLAQDYIYNVDPDYISAWATKVREDDPEGEDESNG